MCAEGRYIYFYTDFAFRRLFGTNKNKALLISFLNAVFNGREVVTDITYLDSNRIGRQVYNRRAVFDVYRKNEKGEYFLVEMQKGEQQFFKDRSIYYSTFAIREQAPRGEWDYGLKGIYTIGILNFCFHGTPGDKEFYHEVKLMDIATKEVFYDKLTFIYLEMPKFTKTEDELETLFDKWLYAIRNLASLMERLRALQEKVFTHLFEAAEISKFDRQERFEYEESLKVYRDWYSVMKTAEEKGFAKGEARGLQKGMEKGLEEGIKKGMEEGATNKALTIARQLKADGLAAGLIAKYTGLTTDEIERL